MGFLSSAYSWLNDKVNSAFGSTPPANMSLNSSGNHISSPIKVDLSDPGPVKVYNPLINGISVNRDDLTKPKVTPYTGGHSASEVYSSPVTPSQLDYLNADLASHYGMSPETAYQEALTNTAYQRSVKDMQAAGLNPAVLFGSGKGSPADSFVSVRSASSGVGRSTRRSSGSSSANGKLFSPGEFYGISAAAGLVSALVTKHPTSYWVGQTVAQGAMTAMNELFRR